MAESYDPDSLWAPFGPFSMMVLQGTGQIVHLKGQVALDEKSDIVGVGDMRAQLRQTLSNIETALGAVGGGMADVISLTQYTTDIQAFMAAGDIRKSMFFAPYPVTTTVEVAALYHPDLLLEITAIAEVPPDRFKRPAEARAMHGSAGSGR